jgi:hypothetical protein
MRRDPSWSVCWRGTIVFGNGDSGALGLRRVVWRAHGSFVYCGLVIIIGGREVCALSLCLLSGELKKRKMQVTSSFVEEE